MNDDAPHMRHVPVLIDEIQSVDRQIALLRSEPVVDWQDVVVLRDLTHRRAELRARAHTIYGHTPAHGGRGPSSAGAMSA